MRMPVLLLVAALMFCLPNLASSQAQAPKSGPELDKLELWIGDWTLVGTAKDGPTEAEYKVDWRLRGRRILGGHFVQIDQVWQGNGPEQHCLEILSYDPINRIYNSSAFESDGTTWVSTATSDGGTYVENGTTRTANAAVVKWRCTWTFSADQTDVSGTLEREQDGAWWTSFTVMGTKAKTPARTQ